MSENGPMVGSPPKWWPRAGWGTVRGYRFEHHEGGGFTLSFKFVPDDGSPPRVFELTDTPPLEELGEYARGVMQDDNLSIKVSAKAMAEIEDTFHHINAMDVSDRKIMFADRSDLAEDAGWTWMPDYTLAKVAPGVLG